MELIHYHFDTLPSTNDWCKTHLASFDPAKLTLVSADEQSAGRGQWGRKWLSPKYLNIYATYCFFDSQEREPLTLTHLMALAIVHILKTKGVHAEIKKPNDVQVNKRKIAGVLSETVPLSSRIGLLIGVGWNINTGQEWLKTIDQPATSLLAETGLSWEPQALLKELTSHFSLSLTQFLN